MYTLLLSIIYLAFISLGLPDSLLGSGWPVMQAELGVPLSYAGIISTIISVGTIVSSLCSDFITKKLGAGLVTSVSVGMTAAALFGFSISDSFIMLCIFAIPYGLGAGAVDAALNNYVALHYSSRHMSWLHAFWGVGVSVSPYIMSFALTRSLGWQTGYRIVSLLQIALTAILFMSLPLWKKGADTEKSEKSTDVTMKMALKIKGVKYCLIAFFGFGVFEATAGLWATSYMALARGVNAEKAAMYASFFYLGEMSGRFLNGFIADKFGDKTMIKTGIFIMLAGTLLIMLPVSSNFFAIIGLVIIGLGAAPVYPCIIHSTPENFGRENTQALVGIQMSSAYTGCTLAPPVFGILAQYVTIKLYPFCLLGAVILMLIMTSLMKKALSEKNK